MFSKSATFKISEETHIFHDVFDKVWSTSGHSWILFLWGGMFILPICFPYERSTKLCGHSAGAGGTLSMHYYRTRSLLRFSFKLWCYSGRWNHTCAMFSRLVFNFKIFFLLLPLLLSTSANETYPCAYSGICHMRPDMQSDQRQSKSPMMPVCEWTNQSKWPHQNPRILISYRYRRYGLRKVWLCHNA